MVKKKRPPGRPKANCDPAVHTGSNCPLCARRRMRKFRRERPRLARAIESRRSDDLRQAQVRARAYVAEYLKRGAIAPPSACERCLSLVTLSPFHPDPAYPRDVAWLCSSCRRIVRNTDEPLTLTWVWPGAVEPRSKAGVVFELDSERWTAIEEEAAHAATGARNDLERATIYLDAFFVAVGNDVREQIYRAGRKQKSQQEWAPYGIALLDRLLRWWVEREARRRARADRLSQANAEGRTVDVIRRKKKVRTLLILESGRTLPVTPAPKPRAPIDEDELFGRLDAALARADAAIAHAQAVVSRPPLKEPTEDP